MLVCQYVILQYYMHCTQHEASICPEILENMLICYTPSQVLYFSFPVQYSC